MYNDNVGFFLARFVSHFCAPGFSLLMGAGIVLLVQSRQRAEWSRWRVARFLILRGVILIALGFVIRAADIFQFIDPHRPARYAHKVGSGLSALPLADAQGGARLARSVGLSPKVKARPEPPGCKNAHARINCWSGLGRLFLLFRLKSLSSTLC